MSRPDGRTNDQLRKVEIELGGLARVDGSARFSFGACRALASVTGPVEVRQLIELPDRATFEVAVRPVAGVPSTPEKALAKYIHDVLHPTLLLTRHPRSLVQLTVLSLSPVLSSTSYAAAHINAATLALLNAASVPMRGVVCAVAVGISKAGDVVLDPADDRECARAGCFAFFFSEAEAPEGEVVWADWKGATTKEEYASAVKLARAGARQVLSLVQSSLLRRIKNDSQMDLS
ncbi:hypothetical protein OPQ81_007259 [Rhizoctonia solani]|nr:hypothetical protein OPQ81_007259 [Rhizoctonia solani]